MSEIVIPQFDQNGRAYTKKERKKLLKEAIKNQEEHSQAAREMSESAKQGIPIEASLFENMEALKEKEAQLKAAGVELPKADANKEANKEVEKILSRFERQKEKGTLREKDLKKAEEFIKLHGNGEQINKFAELKNSFVLQQNPSEKKVDKFWNKVKKVFGNKEQKTKPNKADKVAKDSTTKVKGEGFVKVTNNIKNFFKNTGTKIGSLLKTATKSKGGKLAIIGALIIAATTLFNKDSKSTKNNIRNQNTKNTDETTSNNNETEQSKVVSDDSAEQTQEQEETTAPNSGSADSNDDTDRDVSSMVDENNIYTVKKGDCVWNIAKAYLEETLDRKPTNAEILTETRRIMRKNNIELIDHYYAKIQPNDKLDLSA